MGSMGVSRIKKIGRSLGSNVARASAGVAARLRAPIHVVLVGLDGSGKTTILLRLRYGRYVNTTPTVAFNCEKVRSGGSSWLVWDVGGSERLRPLWRPYTRATDALIFVVDACSSADRLEEARLELQRLLKQQAAQCGVLGINKPPLLLLANKQDLPAAKSLNVLTHMLGLDDIADQHPWMAASACAVTGEGLDQALISLRKLLLASRQKSRQRK
ncbi:Small GTP-binding protein domain [Trinorchestia longiramus]|nr:Small GTP-binding protein domain [Trinorchestia longiramus]